MKKNMAGLILVLFAIALFMTGCEKKAQEKEEAQEKKEFVNHMSNVNFYVNEREQGKLSGRHLRMP